MFDRSSTYHGQQLASPRRSAFLFNRKSDRNLTAILTAADVASPTVVEEDDTEGESPANAVLTLNALRTPASAPATGAYPTFDAIVRERQVSEGSIVAYRPSPSRDSVISPGPELKPRPVSSSFSRHSSSVSNSPNGGYRLSPRANTATTFGSPRPLPAVPRVFSASRPVGRAKNSLHMLSAASRQRATETVVSAPAVSSSASQANAYPSPPASGISPQATHGHILELTNKRIATLEYLRKVYEGDVHYLSTLSHTQTQISSFSSLANGRAGRRATNYLLLGTSLPPLLELHANSPLEYLRALSGLLTEYETYCSLSAESSSSSLRTGRVGQMLKSGMRTVKSRRTSGAADSVISPDSLSMNGSAMNLSSATLTSPTDSVPPTPAANTFGHEFHHLQTPNLPFDPDFNASLGTLIDVLTSTYHDLLALLPPPETCTAAIGEAYAKADKAMRKTLLSALCSEMGDSARKEAKAEIGGLAKMVLSGLC